MEKETTYYVYSTYIYIGSPFTIVPLPSTNESRAFSTLPWDTCTNQNWAEYSNDSSYAKRINQTYWYINFLRWYLYARTLSLTHSLVYSPIDIVCVCVYVRCGAVYWGSFILYLYDDGRWVISSFSPSHHTFYSRKPFWNFILVIFSYSLWTIATKYTCHFSSLFKNG